VIEICEKLSLIINFKEVHFQNIKAFEAAFICGTSPGVLAVQSIEGIAFQVDHPMLRKIQNNFNIMMKLSSSE